MRVIPGLDKDIEDPTAHSLTLHGNLFGQIDLDYVRTVGVDHIQSAAPHFGLTAATTNGATDPASPVHQHLCSDLTRDRAFAPDNGCQSNGFAVSQVAYQFLKKFLHVRKSLILNEEFPILVT